MKTVCHQLTTVGPLYVLLSLNTRSLSQRATKEYPPRSIDRIMRNREKLLLRNEKRKFVIRRRFPPLLLLSSSHLRARTWEGAEQQMVLRAGLFLSMLETLFSLLCPPESGLSCLFQWTVAPLHGINTTFYKCRRQRVGLLNRLGQVVRAFDYIVSIEYHCLCNEEWLEQITFLFLFLNNGM